jgi:16S rRNA (uracil1498-N3)-methyltransferase
MEGEEFLHLRKVLRLEPGDEIAVFDGKGTGFAARILEMTSRTARIVLGDAEPASRESSLRLVLMASLCKGEKFQWVVQKATELGVSEIRPIVTHRADVRPVPGREGRSERWRRVALEACKQSGRTRIPVVREPEDLEGALEKLGGEAGLMMDPDGAAEAWGALPARLYGADTLILAVGPEGGWSPREREWFAGKNFIPLRMGPRVLRTETAAIVSAALLQFLVGDLGIALPPEPSAR